MKNITSNVILPFLMLAICGISVTAQSSKPKEDKDPAYKVGQVWSYKTRANEPKSTFIVEKVDDDSKYGNIIHIAVTGLKMRNPRSSDGLSDKISHMPFSEKAIAQSTIKLLKENVELPDFEEGYGLWREAFDQKRAGFYTVSIAEAVAIAEAGLNQ